MIKLLTLNFKSKLTLTWILLLLTCIVTEVNLQNAYPVMKSGTITFSRVSPSNQYNITYATPFEPNQTIKCVHAIKGFTFQSANLTSTSNLFNFQTQINSCESELISLNCNFIDGNMISLKASYFVIHNVQTQTWVVFEIFDIVNGPIGTGMWFNSYLLDEIHIPVNANVAGASKVQGHTCLQSIHISTNQTMKFKLQSAYASAANQLQTVVFIQAGTTISTIKLQAILFSIIRLQTLNSFHTYFWISYYSPQKILGADPDVRKYDPQYFQTFETLDGITLNFTNISVLINGSSIKSLSMDFQRPSKLAYRSNFVLNSNYFKGSQNYFNWIAFTKIKDSSFQQQNQQQNDSNTLELIKYILSGVLSGLALITVGVIVYIKCFRKKTLTRKPSQQIAPCDAVTMQDFKVEVWQKKF